MKKDGPTLQRIADDLIIALLGAALATAPERPAWLWWPLSEPWGIWIFVAFACVHAVLGAVILIGERVLGVDSA